MESFDAVASQSVTVSLNKIQTNKHNLLHLHYAGQLVNNAFLGNNRCSSGGERYFMMLPIFIHYMPSNLVSRDSSVDTAIGYGLDGRGVGVRVPVGSRIFSSPCRPYRLWGPPTSYPMGTEGSYLEGKAPGA
jgi:hypothetical protein